MTGNVTTKRSNDYPTTGHWDVRALLLLVAPADKLFLQTRLTEFPACLPVQKGSFTFNENKCAMAAHMTPQIQHRKSAHVCRPGMNLRSVSHELWKQVF